MDKKNNELFWVGLLIGIAIMYFWYHPQFQGKDAQEWKTLYDNSQKTIQDWQNSYNALGACLKDKNNQWNYINHTYSYGSYAWIYSSYNSLTSPTEEMKNCFVNNLIPIILPYTPSF